MADHPSPDYLINGKPAYIHNFLCGDGPKIMRQMDQAIVRDPDGISIPGRKPAPTRVMIYLLAKQGEDIFTDDDVANLCLIAMNPIYDVGMSEQTDPPYEIYIGSMLTIMAAIMPIHLIKQSGLPTALRNASIELITRTFNTRRELREFVDPIRDTVINAMGLHDLGDQIQAGIQSLAFATLLLMCKRLVSDSVVPWYRRRYQTIIAMLSKSIKSTGLVPPPLRNCLGYYTVLTARHAVRKNTFLIFRQFSSGSKKSKYANVIAMLVSQMRYTEFTYWSFIYTHIIERNPDILCTADLLGSHLHVLSAAIELLKTMKQEDRPFAKILLRPDECVCLQAKNFKYLLIAARTIASMSNESLKNLRTSGANFHDAAFAERILAYMVTKGRVGCLNAAEELGLKPHEKSRQRLRELNDGLLSLQIET